MALIDMIKSYQELLTEKERLADLTKANNAAIEAAKTELAQQMIDDDCPKIGYGGYTFSLQSKTSYTKKSAEELAESGADFFQVLRDEGLGDLIYETVNAQTLSSTMRNYVEENEDLSEALKTVIKTYDYNDIGRRKDSKKGKKWSWLTKNDLGTLLGTLSDPNFPALEATSSICNSMAEAAVNVIIAAAEMRRTLDNLYIAERIEEKSPIEEYIEDAEPTNESEE